MVTVTVRGPHPNDIIMILHSWMPKMQSSALGDDCFFFGVAWWIFSKGWSAWEDEHLKSHSSEELYHYTMAALLNRMSKELLNGWWMGWVDMVSLLNRHQQRWLHVTSQILYFFWMDVCHVADDQWWWSILGLYLVASPGVWQLCVDMLSRTPFLNQTDFPRFKWIKMIPCHIFKKSPNKKLHSLMKPACPANLLTHVRTWSRGLPTRRVTVRSWVSKGKFCSSSDSPNSPLMSQLQGETMTLLTEVEKLASVSQEMNLSNQFSEACGNLQKTCISLMQNMPPAQIKQLKLGSCLKEILLSLTSKTGSPDWSSTTFSMISRFLVACSGRGPKSMA